LASSFLPQAVTARASSAATRREFFMMGVPYGRWKTSKTSQKLEG
jgi:hypothetical protein